MANKFGQDVQRLQIVRLELPPGEKAEDHKVTAHYNPKEIQVDQSVKWESHPSRDGGWLEYTAGEGRTLAMELLLDCYEQAYKQVAPDKPLVQGEDLEAELALLTAMTQPSQPEGDRTLRPRPPLVTLANGPLRGVRWVLESLSIKIVMFDRWNRPVRATVNVKLKEVIKVRDKKAKLAPART